MEHSFVLEPSLDAFHTEIKKLIAEGYEQVVGSVYVKSVETESTASAPITNNNDVTGIFSIGVEDDYGAYTVVVEENSDDFFMTLTDLLDKGYKTITGSLFIGSSRRNGYIKVDRCYNTWYCCTMYK